MEEFVVDTPKLELLDQMLVDLEQSFGAVSADIRELVVAAIGAVCSLRNGFNCKVYEQEVAQLARHSDWDKTAEAMDKFFLSLQIGTVVEIVRLIYIDEKSLASAIGFVERLVGVKFHQEAYEALYEDICFKGHTEMPEILLLQRNMKQTGESGKQLDEDCAKIIDVLVAGVKAKDYELSIKIVETLGSNILEEKMSDIVEKVQSAGNLAETVLLIHYFEELPPRISNHCTYVQSLFEVLNYKDLLRSDQGLHLWAHAKSIGESEHFANAEASVQNKFTTTCNELGKNKKKYLEIYQSYIEISDGKKIKAFHNVNLHLQTIVSEFVNFYYDGDLKRARFLLHALLHVGYYITSLNDFLSCLYKKMIQFEQTGTFEYVEIFLKLKFVMSSSSYKTQSQLKKRPFEELQAKAPWCLQLILWPKSAGAKFCLINKFYNSPLSSFESKVLCDLKPVNQKEEQLKLSAQVDTCQVIFSHHGGGKLSTEVSGGNLSLTEEGTKWKVKAVDENHIKIYSNDKLLTASASSSHEDANKRGVCLKEEISSSLQIWNVKLAAM